MTASKGQSFIVVAIVLGAAAAVVGYFALTSLAGQAAARSNSGFQNVVVTATDLTFGVKLDREKLREYRELYQRLGGYPYDRDPGRPNWTPIVPNERFADPADGRTVEIPY